MFYCPKQSVIVSLYLLKQKVNPFLKSLTLSVLLLILLNQASGQIQTHLQVIQDSVRLTNGEFILRNNTSSVNGFLYNTGNGITAFKHGLLKIDDTTYIIGSDTLNIKGSANNVTLSGTQTITGDKTFASLPSLSSFNTIDRTTNYEKHTEEWQSSAYTIGNYFGGTGTIRSLQLGVQMLSGATSLSGGARLFSINPLATPNYGIFDFNVNGTATSPNIITMQGTAQSTSATQNWLAIVPTINQSSSAGFTSLLISPYEQNLGSGSNLFLNIGTSSASKGGGTFTPRFQMDRNGSFSINGATNSIGSLLSFGSGSRTAGATWGTTGPIIAIPSININNNTATSGSVVSGTTVASSIGVPTFTGLNGTSSSPVTFSNAATLYIAGAPQAGQYTQLTNANALQVATGATKLGGTLTVGVPDGSSVATDSVLTVSGSGHFKGTIRVDGLAHAASTDSIVSWDAASGSFKASDYSRFSPFLRGAYSFISGSKNIVYLNNQYDTVMFGANNVAYARYNFLGTSNFYYNASFGPNGPSANSRLTVSGTLGANAEGLSMLSGGVYTVNGTLSDIISTSYVNQTDSVNAKYTGIKSRIVTSGYAYQGSNSITGFETLIDNSATGASTVYRNVDGFRAFFGAGSNAKYRNVIGFHVAGYTGSYTGTYFAGLQIDSVTAPVAGLYGVMQKGNNMKNSFAGKILIGNVPSGSSVTDSLLVYNVLDSTVKLVNPRALVSQSGIVLNQSTQQASASFNIAGTGTVGGLFTANHYSGNGNAPATSGLGTNVTSAVITGNDAHFKLTITTSGAVSGTVCNITFASSYSSVPIIVFSNADGATASASSTMFMNASNTSYAVFSGNISGAGTYVYNVMAGQ
jgi:hypothetical protein